mgnify:FL=1
MDISLLVFIGILATIVGTCLKYIQWKLCCSRESCAQKICDKLNTRHEDYVQILKKIEEKSNKIFIRSDTVGTRKYLMLDKGKLHLEWIMDNDGIWYTHYY